MGFWGVRVLSKARRLVSLGEENEGFFSAALPQVLALLGAIRAML